MKSPWQVWLVFLLSLAVVFAGMGWITRTVWQLDEAEQFGRERADVEENVRLALWRIDSYLTNLVVQEGSRPYFAYSALYSADAAYANTLNDLRRHSKVLLPSPLLLQTPPHVKLHFQCTLDGKTFTSPQAPEMPLVEELNPNLLPPEYLAQNRTRLADLRRLLKPQALAAQLSKDVRQTGQIGALARAGQTAQADAGPQPFSQLAVQQSMEPSPIQAQQMGPSQVASRLGGRRGSVEAQEDRNNAEYQARAQTFQQAQNSTLPNYGQIVQARDTPRGAGNFRIDSNRQEGRVGGLTPPPAPGDGESSPQLEDAAVGALQPVWLDDQLLLVRWARINGQDWLQGAWLDWPALQDDLLADIADLLPEARLESIRNEQAGENLHRRSSVLPIRLQIGDVVLPPRPFWSPPRVSLVVAWTCLSAAAVAVALLLLGVVRLSERRAAFVSAVTHELRTPLTTFRMYAEMLSAGMVPDGERQQRYLHTLRVEADRLTHLVENVLAYARLERGRKVNAPQRVSVQALWDQAHARLRGRAEQGEMELRSHLPSGVAEQTLVTDPAAVEQILFNLVDNACKYAAASSTRVIDVHAALQGGNLELRVCDHGPGIDRQAQRRLFRPFSKSVHEAARSAPGVGLGLALSRRLARQLGGELRFEGGNDSQGACFVLTLPAQPIARGT